MPFAIGLIQKSHCSFHQHPCFFSHVVLFCFACFYFPENSFSLSTSPIFLWIKTSSPSDISLHIFHAFQDNFFSIFIIEKKILHIFLSGVGLFLSSCCYKYSYPLFPHSDCIDQKNIENVNICLSPTVRRFLSLASFRVAVYSEVISKSPISASLFPYHS